VAPSDVEYFLRFLIFGPFATFVLKFIARRTPAMGTGGLYNDSMLPVRRHSPEPRLEMTPLIDVVFLLLTFFVFAIVLVVRAEVLDIMLPDLSTGQAPRPGAAITIALDADGSLYVNGEPTPREELIDRLRELRSADPDAALLMAADEAGRSGDLVRLWHELAQAGFPDVALIVRPREGPPSEDR
jgi:biopolymer transport protein ExbD